MAETTDLPVPPAKPGWQTSELWLSLAATLLSFFFASGAITNSTVMAIAGIAATVLTALGYQVSRTLVKRQEQATAQAVIMRRAA